MGSVHDRRLLGKNSEIPVDDYRIASHAAIARASYGRETMLVQKFEYIEDPFMETLINSDCFT